MEIVIDIGDLVYHQIKQHGEVSEFHKLIIHGTPLPKGHGRLIDAYELLKAIDTWDKFGYTETGCFVREPKGDYVPYIHYDDMVKSVSGAETIIEADKER